MKNKFFKLIICLLLGSPNLAFTKNVFGSRSGPDILTHNRVVTSIYGHPISILDIQKEMDLIFYRQFPQYASSPEARYQFYESNWRPIGQQLIDKRLILADAEEHDITIPHGEVRKEIEKTFGPNIVSKLHEAGLTFDEAYTIIETDFIIRRALGARVHSKALKRVTPHVVRDFYDTYAKEHKQPEKWTYSVITLKSKDENIGLQTAQNIFLLLKDEDVDLTRLQKELTKRNLMGDNVKISVADPITLTEPEIAEDFLEPIKALSPGEVSQPISSISKKTGHKVHRIFCLEAHTPEGVPPFKEIEKRLQNYLLEREIQAETLSYLSKLKNRFSENANSLNELFPEEYKPFTLIQ